MPLNTLLGSGLGGQPGVNPSPMPIDPRMLPVGGGSFGGGNMSPSVRRPVLGSWPLTGAQPPLTGGQPAQPAPGWPQAAPQQYPTGVPAQPPPGWPPAAQQPPQGVRSPFLGGQLTPLHRLMGYS